MEPAQGKRIAKEPEEAPEVTKVTMKAGFQVDPEKAKHAQKIVKGTMTTAASMMFAFYSNLLSPESKYAPGTRSSASKRKATHM
jgi:hypothetical protein